MDVTQQLLRRILTAYQAGRSIVLLFDYDGTLVPIVAHPSQAVLSVSLRELLQQLAGQPRVAVGFLSGRTLEELRALVGLPNVYYAGCSGLELDLRGTVHTPPDAAEGRRLIGHLLKPVHDVVALFPGAWVENKGLAATVHYRAVASGLIPSLQEKMARCLQPVRGRLSMVQGPMAMEINPDLGWNKGTALRGIAEHVGPNSLPFFAGDADNDADAFEAALALGGMALWIGATPPARIAFHLPGPANLAEFLARLVKQLEGSVG